MPLSIRILGNKLGSCFHEYNVAYKYQNCNTQIKKIFTFLLDFIRDTAKNDKSWHRLHTRMRVKLQKSEAKN